MILFLGLKNLVAHRMEAVGQRLACEDTSKGADAVACVFTSHQAKVL
jgi:hypothetical protein